jgi:pimeloyl-ACP methyl ester carboxylesterase
MHAGKGLTAPPPTSVYFHGLPGTTEELQSLGIGSDKVIAIDRNGIAAGLGDSAYFATLAQRIAQHGPRLHLIGFSLGAAAALQVAAELPNAVMKIDLIAPAAPPELGDFLDHAAGGPIFRMAAQRPKLFRLTVCLQSFLARHAPMLLMRALFAGSAGADRALAKDPAFRRAIADILRTGLGAQSASYAREITAYVTPWADILPQVAAPVTIWQGDADTWSPPAMAHALAGSLPNRAALHLLPGLSHYSALKAAMPQILNSD